MTTTFRMSLSRGRMFGYESVIGVSVLMGTKESLNRVYTQIAGHGYRCHVEDARREFRLGGYFQSLVLRYVQAQLVQAMQSAGCNAKHNIEQRLARWLLLCADRAHTDTFKISHEFLADMLGVRRPTVSTTAGILKRKGLIDYTRGEIRILDVPAHEGLLRVLSDHQRLPRQLTQGSTSQSLRSRFTRRAFLDRLDPMHVRLDGA